MRIVKTIKSFNFLEKFIILYTLWSIFTGFRHSFGGVTAGLFYGGFNLIIQFCLVLTFVYFCLTKSYVYYASYVSCAVLYSIGFFLCIFFSIDGAPESFNRYILPILYGVGFIVLRDQYKIKVFDAVVNILAVIFALSAIEYIIYVLTNFRLELYVTVDDTRTFTQTLFNNFPEEYAIIPRFMSLCEEPGTVGTLSALLLFVIGKTTHYRKQYIIFWISGLLTFSMAFYVLAAIHILTFRAANVKLLLSLAVLIVVLYNYLGEYFDYLIIERIESGEADNRVSDSINKYLETAWEDGRLWFGNKASFLSSMGFSAGAKALLVRHGILGVVSLVMGYILAYLNMSRVKSFESFMFLLAFWASFYQREYIDRIEFLMLFFALPAMLNVANKQIKNKKEISK